MKHNTFLSIAVGSAIALGSTVTAFAGDRNHFIKDNKVQMAKINTNARVQKTIGIKRRNQNIQGRHLKVKATAYCNDPITATGTVPTVGRTIAVDPRVIPYGSKVYIPQLNATFIAEDCGSAIKGNRIDIYMGSYNECMNWGIQELDIYIID
jgi:3D (Asp-Asp-Asp) domain-containing protein